MLESEKKTGKLPETFEKFTRQGIRHLLGQYIRIISLGIVFVLLVVCLFFVSHYRVKNLGATDAVVGKRAERSVIAYLSPETCIALDAENKGKPELYSCKVVGNAKGENATRLAGLMEELCGDGKDVGYTYTANWTHEERQKLKTNLSESLLQEWTDLSNKGVLPDSDLCRKIVRDPDCKVTIENEKAIDAASLKCVSDLCRLMVSNVDAWGDHNEKYLALFQKIIQPTLSEPVAGDTEVTKVKVVLKSGEFLLKKGEAPNAKQVDKFNAYKKKITGPRWWVFNLSCLGIFVLCMYVFYRVLRFQKSADEKLDSEQEKVSGSFFKRLKSSLFSSIKQDNDSRLYAYFPTLAMFLGLLSNVVMMEVVLLIESCWPWIGEYFPLEYLYVIYPMLLPTLLISMVYHYDIHISLFTGFFSAVIFSCISLTGMNIVIFMGLASSLFAGFLAARIVDDRLSRLYSFICHAGGSVLTFAIMLIFYWNSGKDIPSLKVIVCVIGAVVVMSLIVSIFLTPFCVWVMELCGADTRIIYNQLSNQTSELMRRLAKEAPGTFYHCMKVANMASFAAERMSNDFDARAIIACAMYHDIGKLYAPDLFTENGGDLDKRPLTYAEKAEVIRRHVSEGERIAREEKLPTVIRKVIQTHHGKDFISYFYEKAKKKGDFNPNDSTMEAKFRYEGPNPKTPEAFLIGMADACEAAVRGMSEEFTRESITNMVDKVFAKRRKANFMENANVKICELKNMKEAFVEHLCGEAKRLNYEYKLRCSDKMSDGIISENTDQKTVAEEEQKTK